MDRRLFDKLSNHCHRGGLVAPAPLSAPLNLFSRDGSSFAIAFQREPPAPLLSDAATPATAAVWIEITTASLRMKARC